MAKYTTSKITIDGQDFLPSAGYKVSINQKMVGHHSFSVSFPTEATETNGGLIDSSINYIGKKISISVGDQALEFMGIITDIDLSKTNGSNGSIILSGHSPTILMDQTVQSSSYDEGTSFDQVISQTSEEYPADLISIISENETSLKLPYTVQYNETDFGFLKRMCVRYGLWFYYNGIELCVGAIGDGTNEGVYGHTIDNFHLGVKLQQQQFGLKSHDWISNELLESEADAFQSGTTHSYADQIKRESDAVYRKKGSLDFLHTQNEYSGQKGVDDVTKVHVLGKAANMVMASGGSELSDLRIGNILTVEGINFEDASKLDALGSYILTEVNHTFDHAGHYQNTWKGVPDGTTHPDYSDIFEVPKAESQRGTVIDNLDPDGLGRVKVQFPWQKQQGTNTPWVKVNTPYAGQARGFYFIPEIDDEVLIGFEGGNAERPLVLSTGFNATATSEVDNTNNNIKAIITKSGHTIEFDDTDGEEKITIHDNGGSEIIFDTKEKSLLISATENIEISAKNIKLVAEEKIEIQSQDTIDLTAQGDLTALTKATLAMQSDSDTKLKSKAAFAIEGMTDTTVKGQNTVIEGKVGAEMNGTNTKITGKAMAELSSAMTKIN